MATIKEVLFKLVTDDAGVASFITSTGGFKRMFPVRTPDNVVFPAISYQLINKDNTIGMRLDGRADLVGDLYGINIWAPRIGPLPTEQLGSEMAEEIAGNIRDVLNGFRGTVLSVDIQKISLENESDGWEPDLELYRVSQQYRVFHRQG